MSQTNHGDEFDDEWEEFTPSQLFAFEENNNTVRI